MIWFDLKLIKISQLIYYFRKNLKNCRKKCLITNQKLPFSVQIFFPNFAMVSPFKLTLLDRRRGIDIQVVIFGNAYKHVMRIISATTIDEKKWEVEEVDEDDEVGKGENEADRRLRCG